MCVIEKLNDPSLSPGVAVPIPGSSRAPGSALLLLRLLVRVHLGDGPRFTLGVHSVSRLT